MASQKLWYAFSFYLSTLIAIFQYLLSNLLRLIRLPVLVTLADTILELYFRLCGLSPCTVDLDDQTTMHFWTASHRRFNKPGLVLVHGYGGNSRWQFLRQVGPLSRSFDLYIPDLLFFGRSYTSRPDRTEVFQAKCVADGLKRLGLDRFLVYGISYGGFVAYWMAEMHPEVVEKVVIVSSGIGYTGDQKREYLDKIGRNVLDLLVPNKPHDLRSLVNLSVYKYNLTKWVPDFFFSEFINVMYKEHREEKLELLEHLLAQEAYSNVPILTQETLIIWGDKDNVFPVFLAHQLHSHLGPKSKVAIIKDTGHAVNIDSPGVLNELIKSFVLGSSKYDV